MASLAERLGASTEARLVILDCVDLGLSHAACVGVYDALRNGVATTASLLVPAPWARYAASEFRGEDVGVHLALNAEHDRFRWGPLTLSPSLLDGDGGFPRTISDLWDHADLDEVRKECRAQIERAVLWGIDLSHLGTHLDALLLRPEFFDIYLDLALEFALPLRLPDAEGEAAVGFPLRQLAADEGAVFADRSQRLAAPRDLDSLASTLADLKPGVTELTFHPAVDTPELRAATDDWPSRAADYSLLCSPAAQQIMADSGVTLIGYRPLRDLARSLQGS
jgi:hypothetical protein